MIPPIVACNVLQHSFFKEVEPLKRKITAVLLLFIFLLNFTGCAQRKTNDLELKRYQAQFLELFDTVTTIIGYSDTEEHFTELANMIHDDLQDYHELYDKYHDYEGINNIKTINDNAGIKPVKVDQRIIEMLQFSKEAYEISEGKVNVAFGAVLSVWHDYREEGTEDPTIAKLPPMELLQEKAKHINIEDMIIDEKNSTVYLQDPDMSLDVGAIAKGYATEQVAQLVIKAGYDNVLLSVGGNVRAVGKRAGQDGPWNVGIQNPEVDSDEKYLDILNIDNLSLVSSGDYERYYTVDGVEYHHIISPDTLMPSDYFTAVSIVCENSGLADALSTAIFNLPYEKGLQLIEGLPDTEALWVFDNGEIKYSSGFEALIKKPEENNKKN